MALDATLEQILAELYRLDKLAGEQGHALEHLRAEREELAEYNQTLSAKNLDLDAAKASLQKRVQELEAQLAAAANPPLARRLQRKGD